MLVGLGNPGNEYYGTRHNVGFSFIDKLLQLPDADVSLLSKNKFKAEFWKFFQKDIGELILVKPQTFMNLSGEAVSPLLNWFKLASDSLIVVHDELDIPVGSIRFKFGGGNAGHNGLKSITLQLGTPNFYRLRIGIGRPQYKSEIIQWVLGHPSPADAELQELSLCNAYKTLQTFIARGEKEASRFALSCKN